VANTRLTDQSVNNKKRFVGWQILIIVVLIVFYAPNICLFQIAEINMYNTTSSLLYDSTNQSIYTIDINQFARENKYLIVILSALQIFVHLFYLVLMIAFSVLTVSEIIKIKRKCEKIMHSSFKIRRLMNRNLKLKDQVLNRFKKKEILTAKMVLYLSLIFIINEFSAVIASSLETYRRVSEPTDVELIQYIGLFLFYISIISNTANVFVYKKFSKVFDKKIKQVFSSIFKSNESKKLRSSIIRSRHRELLETRFMSSSIKHQNRKNDLYLLHKANILNKPKRIRSF
jgi:hypothetical protein